MTQITLEAPRITSGAPSGRWLKSLSRHAGRMLAFLACYPPYSLEVDPPVDYGWKRYEPAWKWLDEHQG